MTLISVTLAAKQCAYSARHIARLCERGVVAGQKFGATWAVDAESLAAYAANPPKSGPRPTKE